MAAEARWRAWPHGPVRRARRGLERGGERAGGDLAAACRACPTHAAPDRRAAPQVRLSQAAPPRRGGLRAKTCGGDAAGQQRRAQRSPCSPTATATKVLHIGGGLTHLPAAHGLPPPPSPIPAPPLHASSQRTAACTSVPWPRRAQRAGGENGPSLRPQDGHDHGAAPRARLRPARPRAAPRARLRAARPRAAARARVLVRDCEVGRPTAARGSLGDA